MFSQMFAGGPGAWGWGWGFGPRGTRRGFFNPGEVRLALLALLEEGPAHGYGLMKRLEERSGGLYQASPGTIYPVLQQLEDEGLAASAEEDGKRVYRITDEGRAELERERETVERIWKRAGRWREWGQWFEPETTEIASVVGRLIKTAFRAAARGGPNAHESILQILDRAREELEALSTE